MCNQWIAVGEQLPVVGEIVLVSYAWIGSSVGLFVITARLAGSNPVRWRDDHNNSYTTTVTHWQPLPTPSQSEA